MKGKPRDQGKKIELWRDDWKVRSIEPHSSAELNEMNDPERECCVFGCDFCAQPVQNLERQS